jgi:hypothetical protein
VDANAVTRSKTGKDSSIMGIAKSTMAVATAGGPREVIIFFDLKEHAMYPAKRAEVAQARAARAPPPYAMVLALLKQVGKTTLAEIADIDAANVPLLNTKDIAWNVAFGVPEFKALAWRALAQALRIVAASGTVPVTIHCADGLTTHTVSATECTTTVATFPKNRDFGEADLRVWDCATSTNAAGMATVIHTIDTDYLAMMLASTWFTPTATFLIALKGAVYNGLKMLNCIDNTSECSRLNAAYFMFACGGDYVNTLTNNGFYRKELTLLIKDRHESGPFAMHEKKCCFFLHRAKSTLSPLKRRNMKKYAPKKALSVSLMDMHWSVLYYGLHFKPSISPAPNVLIPTTTPLPLPDREIVT